MDKKFPDGKLTQEHRDKFEAWINSKSALIGKCPVCTQRSWTVLEHFVELPIYRGGGVMVAGGATYPNIGLVCTNCGNTQLMNAALSGILSENSTADKATVNESDE